MDQNRLKHGQYYHIYNRGNNKEPIFKDEENYLYFLALYKKYIIQLADLYAYCLLPTHFHLLIQIKDFKEIDCMYKDGDVLWMQFRRFLGTYTKAVNQIYRRSGCLFEGKFSRVSLSENGHFLGLIASIHQNPQNHGIVSDYKYWPFSSYHAYVKRDRRSLLARKLFTDEDLYNTILMKHEEGLGFQDFNKRIC